MFETETMAELCVKQGLFRDALAIYRRLLLVAPDADARERRERRIAEIELRLGIEQPRAPRSIAAAPAPPAVAPAAAVSAGAAVAPLPIDLALPGIQARRDEGAHEVTLEWRLPDDTRAPALQILVLRREPGGIAAERRTVPLDQAAGQLKLPLDGVHSVRAAAGRLDGDRFVPLARLE